MALILAGRVKETTITSGLGSMSLGGALAGFQSFSEGVGDGNSTYYGIENFGRWEVGIGTYKSGDNTLSRDIILSSSNDGSKISLEGASIVFITYPAEKAFILNEDGYADGVTPYSGIIFPDESIQETAAYLSGVGLNEAIPYWDGELSFSYDPKLTWSVSDSKLVVDGTGEFSGDLSVAGDLSVDGTTAFTRTSAGNIFHAYVDNTFDRTIGLYLDNESSPTWRLGLKNSPSSFTEIPSQGYAYGNNGSVGMYATSDSAFLLHYTTGFWVKHKDSALFNLDRTEGMVLYNAVASTTALKIKSAALQSSNLQEWQSSIGTVLASISSAGAITVPTLYFNDGTSQTTAIPTDTNPDHTHRRRYTTITDSAILTPTHDAVFVDSSSSSVTITLPTAVDNGGEEFTIKRATGDNIVTIDTYSSETIDGESSFNIEHLYEAVTIISNNSNWYLI